MKCSDHVLIKNGPRKGRWRRCRSAVYAGGRCWAHYQQWERWGLK